MADVRIVHERRGDALATDIEVADSLLATLRGLRFRRSLPDERALLFRFDAVGRRDVDMLFVPFPIDVLWLVEGRVERVDTLRAWFDLAIARADTLVELPAGTASEVSEGDVVSVEEHDE
jgi:uncharacterized membrane protein (UPF0127 family)